MATQDWFNALGFNLQPGSGVGDVHSANWLIYTETREIMLAVWFHLVPTTTDLWDVTLTLQDGNHSFLTLVQEPGFSYPLGDSDDGTGATGPYQGPFVLASGIVGYCAVPIYARAGVGDHTLQFNEVGGDFFVNFDGAWYDLTPAQGPESYTTPIVCYSTIEDGWHHTPSCFPVYAGGCETRGWPVKPQGSLAVVYGDGGPDPLLTSQTSANVDITCTSFDARGVFWTNFHKSFET